METFYESSSTLFGFYFTLTPKYCSMFMTFCHVLQCYLECFFPRNSFDSYYKLPATLCIPYPKLMKLEGRFWLQTEKLNKQGFPCSSPWPCEMFLKYLETKLFAVWEVASLSQTKFHISHFYYNGNLALYPTRSQAGTVQKKQEQEPLSVCRDVPELRTFSASESSNGAQLYVFSREPPSSPGLVTWISNFRSIFSSYKGKRSKGMFTVLLVSAPSFRNKSEIAIKAVR